MVNPMRFLLALVFALPVAAQSPALSLQMFGPSRVPLGGGIAYTIQFGAGRGAVLEIDFPGTFLDGSGGGSQVQCDIGKPMRCTVIDPVRTSHSLFILVQEPGPGLHTATARLTAGSDMRTASVTTDVVARPSLVIDAGPFQGSLSPRQPYTFFVTAINNSSVAATNVVLTVSLPAGRRITGFESDAFTCSLTDVLTCTAPRVTSGDRPTVDVAVTAPERVEGPFIIDVSVRADEEDFHVVDNNRRFFMLLNRELRVTNTSDSGDGSLRTAILDANNCLRRTPCSIVFQIPGPVPAGGKFVIQPRTPLPELTGEVKVDGATQTLLTGDTNPDGPEIEINGALLGEGAGLRLSPNCVGEIYDLAVTGFPGHGIDVSRMPGDPAPEACHVSGSTLRVTIARNHLTGNLRGIGVRSYYTTIESNVITANRRSGIFVSDGAFSFIRSNRIESNGASGVFVNADDSKVTRNVIAGNAEAAVSRTPRGDAAISANSMFGNGHQAIDVGLDFETPANRPVLFWAIYDPARNATVVRGRFDADSPPFFARYDLELYASSALSRTEQPQAEQPLTERQLAGPRDSFEVVLPGDLRGKWITATATLVRVPYFSRGPRTNAHDVLALPADTSELSNAVFVAR
jgi:parallel beta-helix repeat protein